MRMSPGTIYKSDNQTIIKKTKKQDLCLKKILREKT